MTKAAGEDGREEKSTLIRFCNILKSYCKDSDEGRSAQKDKCSEENPDLMRLYYSRLQSNFDNLLESVNKDSEAVKSIALLLKNGTSWDEAYDIEQKMVFIIDDDALDFEIEKKLLSSTMIFLR